MQCGKAADRQSQRDGPREPRGNGQQIIEGAGTAGASHILVRGDPAASVAARGDTGDDLGHEPKPAGPSFLS